MTWSDRQRHSSQSYPRRRVQGLLPLVRWRCLPDIRWSRMPSVDLAPPLTRVLLPCQLRCRQSTAWQCSTGHSLTQSVREPDWECLVDIYYPDTDHHNPSRMLGAGWMSGRKKITRNRPLGVLLSSQSISSCRRRCKLRMSGVSLRWSMISRDRIM